MAYSPRLRAICELSRQQIAEGKGVSHEQFWAGVEKRKTPQSRPQGEAEVHVNAAPTAELKRARESLIRSETNGCMTGGDPVTPVVRRLRTARHMSADQHQKPTNFTRRGFGIALALLPLALLFASIIVGIVRSQRPHFASVGLIAAASVVAALNFYLSFIRPRLFSLSRGSMDGYRHVSVFPVIGTALLSLGAVFSFGAIGSALIGVVVFALDTGGPVWFVIATWRDRSFWDT